jgi:di/tricarboxylate transporter
MIDLERIQGLVPVADEGYEMRAAERRDKMLCEAVISTRSPLIGVSIRDADFRAQYNSAVVAVHRGGERVRGRIGDIVLRAGDTLLLQTGPHFGRAHKNNPDFYLVSDIEESRPFRHENAVFSLVLVALLVVLMATYDVAHDVRVVIVAFTIAFFMVVSRCISATAARKSIDWEIVLTIGAAFGLGHALENSGAAGAIAQSMTAIVGGLGHHALLLAVYVLTGVFAALVSSKASVVLMFPIAIGAAQDLGISPRPLIMAVAYAGAATFATPLGYPTNLMVYGPGGYRFADFMKVGLPLTVLLSVLAAVLIPLVWPF